MATRSMAIRIRAVIGISFCRCTNFPTRPYEEPMKLSYFSYDFWECCCEAVNAGGWAGVFRRFSAVSLAVNPTHFSIATRVAKPPIAGSSLLLGRAALSARGRRLEARPGPAATHGHRSQAPHVQPHTPHSCAHTQFTPVPTPNFARNSPATASSFELRSLELQRFQTLLNGSVIGCKQFFV